MPEKNEIARILAEAHREIEPTITRIVQLVSPREDDAREPVKLLEVNPATTASGILPIAFSPAPPSVPYPSIVVEVTEQEYTEILGGRLGLPNGWRLGKTLYARAA